MGSEVIVTCKCGLETYILIGGGATDFPLTCYFPCLCERCSNVVRVNLLSKKPRCPECESTKVIPYDETTLLGRAGKHTVAEWNMQEELGRELKLTDGKYKCPKCGKMTLGFADSGTRWD